MCDEIRPVKRLRHIPVIAGGPHTVRCPHCQPIARHRAPACELCLQRVHRASQSSPAVSTVVPRRRHCDGRTTRTESGIVPRRPTRAPLLIISEARTYDTGLPSPGDHHPHRYKCYCYRSGGDLLHVWIYGK